MNVLKIEKRIQVISALVEGVFGGDADYAMLHKVYGASNEPQARSAKG